MGGRGKGRGAGEGRLGVREQFKTYLVHACLEAISSSSGASVLRRH